MVPVSIKSLQHPIVKELTHLRKNAKARHQANEALVCGHKMVAELGRARSLKTLLILENLNPNDYPPALHTYFVTEGILKKITGLEHPEGVVATLAIPKSADLTGKKRLLILDHISDPGNLGTLLRTACALCYDGAFLVHGVDPYNDKALRAAKGATFHLPLASGTVHDALLIIKGLTAYAGALDGKPLEECKPLEPFAVIVSSESHGISDELAKHCQRITIPMNTCVDSLNVAVAGGILLYALDPRRLR